MQERTPRLRTLNGVQYPVFVEASKINYCMNIMKELVTAIVRKLTVWSPKMLQLTENTRNITACTYNEKELRTVVMHVLIRSCAVSTPNV